MSNRNPPGVYDATGVSRGVVLALGEDVDDVTTGQKLVGDGITRGGMPQVAQYPYTPHLAVTARAARAFTGFDQYVWDATNKRIRPTSGAQDVNNGIPDSATVPSMWKMAICHTAYYDAWKNAVASGDAATAAANVAKIKGNFAFVQASYTNQQLKGGTGFVISSDDGEPNGLYFMQVAEVFAATGSTDTTARDILRELIPTICQRFRDTQGSGNTVIDYGFTTPGGIAFKSNALGLRYFETAQTGLYYSSTTTEVGMAIAACSLARDATLPAAERNAFLTYAQNTWSWIWNSCRTPDPSTDAVAGPPAADIFYRALNLDPVAANYNATTGAQYKGSWFAGNNRKPVRGQTAYADSASTGMACLSADLYAITSNAQYLTAVQRILAAFPLTTAFGKSVNGVTLIANRRDPWTNKIYDTMIVWKCFPGGVPLAGVDPQGAFRVALVNSAKAVTHGLAKGLMSPDYAGREYASTTGNYDWIEEVSGGQNGDAQQDYGGINGGGQARPEQMHTAANLLTMAMAGAMLEPFMGTLGSGAVGPISIETLSGEVAALALAQQDSFSKRGGFITNLFGRDSGFYLGLNTNPFINFDGGGNLIQFRRDAAGRYFSVNVGAEKARIDVNGVRSLGTLTSDYAVYVNNSTTQQFYLYQSGSGGRAINFENATYFQYDTPNIRYQWVIGGSSIGTWDGNGVLAVLSTIRPVNPGASSLGDAQFYFSQVYARSGSINTSDLNEKTVRGGYTDSELAAGREIVRSGIVYQLNDALADKGPDGARWHFGYGAQTVWGIFQAHGIDPTRYGCNCFDDLPAVPARPAVAAVEYQHALVDDEGVEIKPAVLPQPAQPAMPEVPAIKRYGLRLDELHALLFAVVALDHDALAQRVSNLEAAAKKAA